MNRQSNSALWQNVIDSANKAESSGHLKTFSGRLIVVDCKGIEFVVRFIPDLSTNNSNDSSTKPKNPFLPPDPELFIQSLGSSHNLILNKFSVLKNHCLITTKSFVAQTDQLNLADFQAIETVLTEVDGLVFYNGGRTAGASQAHRHFQLVAKDLGNGHLPIASAVQAAAHEPTPSVFPFKHRLYFLPDFKSATLLDAWKKLEYSWQAYNLLMTREWMLVIPRRAEQSEGISINALGFAGALLAKTQTELALIRQYGPLWHLQQVCFDDK